VELDSHLVPLSWAGPHPYDTPVRAVVLGSNGEPSPADVAEPAPPGDPVDVLACGLCGSDMEKIGVAPAGTVLGHEVVARAADGRRVALIHHVGCGVCARCLSGHESTCERFPEPTIVPGGFAERVRASGWVELPDAVPDAVGTYVEPLACVLRGAERVPRGRVLVVGNGFIGRLFGAVLARRGDTVFAVDRNPARAGVAPDGQVDAVVLSAPGGMDLALDAVEPGGTVLVFADAGAVPAAAVYRRELTVVGSRSATPGFMEQAVELLPELDVPEPTVVGLEDFGEAVRMFREGVVVKVVVVP
jgi:L-iditol 2-dehydrogenase